MSEAQCWRCGNAVAVPRNRSDRCGSCEAELYCCRMCLSFAPQLHRRCRNDRAEPPRDPDTANFCDWLEPNRSAHDGGKGDAGAAARAALDDLFKS